MCLQTQYLTMQLCDNAGFSSHNTCRRYAEGYSTKAGWQSELHVLLSKCAEWPSIIIAGWVTACRICMCLYYVLYIVFTVESDRHSDKNKILYKYNFFSLQIKSQWKGNHSHPLTRRTCQLWWTIRWSMDNQQNSLVIDSPPLASPSQLAVSGISYGCCCNFHPSSSPPTNSNWLLPSMACPADTARPKEASANDH